MNASIISPVSRRLAVTDIQRSVDFFVNKLGFEKVAGDPAEVRSGAARISFATYTDVSESGGILHPPGKAIVFFEINDVHTMQAQLRAGDIDCTEPEKVNWIKMEMFAVTDPDGHQLWFGRSYHQEFALMHSGEFNGQMRTVMPALPCKDVAASVRYYTSVLGFSVNYQQEDLAVLDRDQIRLLLTRGEVGNNGTGQCYVYVYNADDLYRELISKGADINSEPLSQPWGLREFFVKDPDGNTIGLGQTFE